MSLDLAPAHDVELRRAVLEPDDGVDVGRLAAVLLGGGHVLEHGREPEGVFEQVALVDHAGVDGAELAGAAGQREQALVPRLELDLARALLLLRNGIKYAWPSTPSGSRPSWEDWITAPTRLIGSHSSSAGLRWIDVMAIRSMRSAFMCFGSARAIWLRDFSSRVRTVAAFFCSGSISVVMRSPSRTRRRSSVVMRARLFWPLLSYALVDVARLHPVQPRIEVRIVIRNRA